MRQKRARRNSDKKKEEILRTVLQLFLKKGYNATSTNDICSAAKIAKPTLYYYFGSKQNLLFSLHQDHLNRGLRPYLEEAAAISDPEQRFHFMIRTYTKMICAMPELRFLIHETLGFKDKYFVQIKTAWKNHYILLRDTVKSLQAAGKADLTLKPSWTALFLIGMMTWITFWLDFKRNQEIEEIAESAVNFACQAISRPSSETPLIEACGLHRDLPSKLH